MSTKNRVILIGNLGRDPEVRTFQNGSKVANLRVATSDQWKDRNTGGRRERTEWHSVAVFADPAIRYAEQYLRKGSKVFIEAKLETRKWQDQSGQDRYTTEVVVRPYDGELKGLDRPGGSQESRGSYGDERGNSGGSSSGGSAGSGTYGSAQHDLDDEIPF